MKDKLNFDRKKHSMYPKAMGKKIRGKLIADFGETVGNQLWEKTRLKYAELMQIRLNKYGGAREKLFQAD